MKLTEAKSVNNLAYIRWIESGMHEAYDELNDSNRELIRAYVAEYPKAKGYKAWQGIIDININELYNFCIDVVFDGSQESIDAIMREKEEFKRLDIAEAANGFTLAWT